MTPIHGALDQWFLSRRSRLSDWVPTAPDAEAASRVAAFLTSFAATQKMAP